MRRKRRSRRCDEHGAVCSDGAERGSSWTRAVRQRPDKLGYGRAATAGSQGSQGSSPSGGLASLVQPPWHFSHARPQHFWCDGPLMPRESGPCPADPGAMRPFVAHASVSPLARPCVFVGAPNPEGDGRGVGVYGTMGRTRARDASLVVRVRRRPTRRPEATIRRQRPPRAPGRGRSEPRPRAGSSGLGRHGARTTQ